MQDFYIKNMVSAQCMEIVEKVLERLTISVAFIEPGWVQMSEPIDESKKKELEILLKKAGFALIEDETMGLVNQIKSYIIKLVHYRKEGEKINTFISTYLSKKMGESYHALNRLFSRVEGESIGSYTAKQKVERAKELLTEDYSKYNTTDISIDLGYHSPGHLCAQFKKITGVTLTSYRAVGMKGRKVLKT